MKNKQELNQIKAYALNYHYPIMNINSFNKLLKENGLKSVKKKTLVKLLNY
jgi:hypothetical protein